MFSTRIPSKIKGCSRSRHKLTMRRRYGHDCSGVEQCSYIVNRRLKNWKQPNRKLTFVTVSPTIGRLFGVKRLRVKRFPKILAWIVLHTIDSYSKTPECLIYNYVSAFTDSYDWLDVSFTAYVTVLLLSCIFARMCCHFSIGRTIYRVSYSKRLFYELRSCLVLQKRYTVCW